MLTLKPDYLSDIDWKKYREMFVQSPLQANTFLNDIEISHSVEHCYSWPKILVIEVTPLCNVMCRFCSQTQYHQAFKEGRDLDSIDVEKLKVIFSDIEVGYPLHVDLSGNGEPLYGDDFDKIFMFVKDKFPFSNIRLCTNGTLLNAKRCELLLDGNIAWINISLNAGSPEGYESVTGTKLFNTIKSNILYMQRLKAKKRTKTPGIGMTYVLTRYNLNDLENFVYLCAELKVNAASAFYMTVTSKEMYYDSVIYEKKRTNEVLERAYRLAKHLNVQINLPTLFPDVAEISEVQDVSLFDFNERRREYWKSYKEALISGVRTKKAGSVIGDPSKRQLIESESNVFRCSYPWDFFSITSDTAAQLCCGAIGYENGSLIQDGFMSVWNGPVRRFLRRTVNSDRVDKICNVCTLSRVRDVSVNETHYRPNVIEKKTENKIIKLGDGNNSKNKTVMDIPVKDKNIKLQMIRNCQICGSESFRIWKQVGEWNLQKCCICGFIFLNPRPDKSYLKGLYDPLSQYNYKVDGVEFIKREKEFIDAYHTQLKHIEKLIDKGRLLEVGSALGFFLEAARQRGWKPVGVELSQGGAEYCREKYGIETYCGEIEGAGFPSGYFDCIVTIHTLEHVNNPGSLIKECSKVLRLGGLLIIEIPYVSDEKKPDCIAAEDIPAHLSYFTQKTLKRLVESNDCMIIDVQKGDNNIRVTAQKGSERHSDVQKTHLKKWLHRKWLQFINRPRMINYKLHKMIKKPKSVLRSIFLGQK